jgi:hypothetical protein
MIGRRLCSSLNSLITYGEATVTMAIDVMARTGRAVADDAPDHDLVELANETARVAASVDDRTIRIRLQEIAAELQQLPHSDRILEISYREPVGILFISH